MPAANSRPSSRAACASAPASRAPWRSIRELLFLDEPTSGLDPIAAADFDRLVADLRSSLGLTVFMVTHDLDSIYTIADRVAVLVDQELRIGTIDEMRRDQNPWIARYFGGPRGRAAEVAQRTRRRAAGG